jgi:hypothetical protein
MTAHCGQLRLGAGRTHQTPFPPSPCEGDDMLAEHSIDVMLTAPDLSANYDRSLA